MPTWILLALLIYYAGVFLPSLFLIPRIGIASYVGKRDSDPEPDAIAGRAQRASRNFQENLAPFLALALLALTVPDIDLPAAILGAQVFVVARLAYLPLYLFAVPVLRSAAYTLGFIGLIMMAMALI